MLDPLWILLCLGVSFILAACELVRRERIRRREPSVTHRIDKMLVVLDRMEVADEIDASVAAEIRETAERMRESIHRISDLSKQERRDGLEAGD